jgi:hypothetical protein
VSKHLTQDEIELFANAGGSPAPEARRAHADTCARCLEDIRAWRALDGLLVRLRQISPAPGFTSRVMGRVRLPVPLHERALALARRRWAVVTAAAATLALTVTGSAYWLFGSQGLTPLEVGVFVLGGARDLAVRGLLALGRVAYDFGLVDAGSTFADQLSPTQALGGLALAGMMGLLAAATMMRLMRPAPRLVVTPSRD